MHLSLARNSPRNRIKLKSTNAFVLYCRGVGKKLIWGDAEKLGVGVKKKNSITLA
jgi:hypothetical protein